jgi:hypothetical protein
MLNIMLSMQSLHIHGFEDPIRRLWEMMVELKTRVSLVVTPDPASWIFCQGAKRHST